MLQPMLGGRPELGVCLGKYDFVVEFTNDSVMLASFKIRELQKSIRKELGINSSASFYLCKELFTAKHDGARYPLHSYMFLRPSTLRYPTTKLSDALNHAAKLAGSGTVFWNSTSYSAMVRLDSVDALRLIKGLVAIRSELGNLISESSTFFSLTLGSRGLSQDVESKGKLPCIIHVKMRNFDVDYWQHRRTSLGYSYVTLGWFDLSFFKSYGSVHQMVNSVLGFRKRHRDQVIETETVVLQTGE